MGHRQGWQWSLCSGCFTGGAMLGTIQVLLVLKDQAFLTRGATTRRFSSFSCKSIVILHGESIFWASSLQFANALGHVLHLGICVYIYTRLSQNSTSCAQGVSTCFDCFRGTVVFLFDNLRLLCLASIHEFNSCNHLHTSTLFMYK